MPLRFTVVALLLASLSFCVSSAGAQSPVVVEGYPLAAPSHAITGNDVRLTQRQIQLANYQQAALRRQLKRYEPVSQFNNGGAVSWTVERMRLALIESELAEAELNLQWRQSRRARWYRAAGVNWYPQ